MRAKIIELEALSQQKLKNFSKLVENLTEQVYLAKTGYDFTTCQDASYPASAEPLPDYWLSSHFFNNTLDLLSHSSLLKV